jgi:hypothetical protein
VAGQGEDHDRDIAVTHPDCSAVPMMSGMSRSLNSRYRSEFDDLRPRELTVRLCERSETYLTPDGPSLVATVPPERVTTSDIRKSSMAAVNTAIGLLGPDEEQHPQSDVASPVILYADRSAYFPEWLGRWPASL